MSTLTLLTPGFLWALLLVPLIWFLPTRVADRRHGLLRSLLLVCLILGMSRPVLLDDAQAPCHVVILDQSASLDTAQGRAAEASLARVRAGLPAAAVTTLIHLAAEPAAAGQQDEPVRGFDHSLRLDGTKRSALGAALDCALAAIPRGAPAAVTLISDGLATDRHWGGAMAELQRRRIPLHTIALAVDAVDPRPVAMDFAPDLRVGHTAELRVRLVGRATGAALRLSSAGETLAELGGLDFAGSRDLVLRFEPRQAGFCDMELSLAVPAGQDPRPQTNVLRTRVAVQQPLQVLYLGHRMQGGAAQLQQLLGDGFAVREPRAEESPAQELQASDVVVLDDRPAKELPVEWRQGLAAAVRERGLGLLASGGRAAFGSGGYHRTEIEEMLPVEFVQKEEKKDPSTTLAIIIDSSGSMVGSRMTLAKQVARLAMRRLQPHDKVGIVEFYGTKSWAAPIQSAANQIDLQRALNRLDAGGGTVLMPAIEEAYYAMKNVQTRYKHVLVLTDAGVETGDYESRLRRMADEGMTVSTVLVGPGRHSDFLVDLADWGGGRYYNATDRFNLPELLLKKPSTSVLPAYRPERTVVEASGGPGWFGEVDPAQLPPLDGFVECELRPGAEELIATKENRSPVLATRLYGLGRVTALMTEPTGPGTRGWAGWQGFGPLLGRVLSRTARGQQRPFRYQLRRQGARVQLEAERLLRGPVLPHLSYRDADGQAAQLALDEVAPGLFRQDLIWPAAAHLELEARVRPGPGAAPLPQPELLISPAGADQAPEAQVDPAAAFPLAAAAQVSGGVHRSAPVQGLELPASAGTAPLRLRRVWPWLVLASLILFLLDVFHRRRARPAVAPLR